jgi:histidinol-phosphate aminotransferase
LLRYAEAAGSEIIRVPVNEALNADLDGMRRALRNDTVMVYLVNPNNPVPSVIEKNAMREFVLEMSEKYLVFVDEAYHEYVEDPDYASMMDLVAEGHNNIIVSRTASKIHGLAGLRVGFGFAHTDLIREMWQRKTGNTQVLGLKAAEASYLDDEFQQFSIRKNRESREIVAAMCEELGLRYIKSNTNFTFIQTGMKNSDFQAKMNEYGILTGRDFPPYDTTWSRVSMSMPEEMEYFVQIYKRLFA